MGSVDVQSAKHLECDVLIVGAGIGGIQALYRLRKKGYTAKAFEAGSRLGGTWNFNRYPGARVDSKWPHYQLNIPEVSTKWTFDERFPDGKSILAYIDFVDKTVDISKDVEFNSRICHAQFDEASARWNLQSENGTTATSKHLIVAAGPLNRKNIPKIPGLDAFKGQLYHSSEMPEDPLEVKGKRVAVIGGGATAVQIVQEWAKTSSHLTNFLRRPTHCFQSYNRKITREEHEAIWPTFDTWFTNNYNTGGGIPGHFLQQKATDATAEEREKLYTSRLAEGGFACFDTFSDTMIDAQSNRYLYDHWRAMVHGRMKNKEKAEFMAPVEPVYPVLTKRPPLETDYYEMLDRDNVDIVGTLKNPITEVTPTGMKLADGKQFDFDVIVFATGFEAYHGSMTRMGLKNTSGVELADVWKKGVWTSFGMFVHGFPNMTFLAGPQAPSALTNVPCFEEVQLYLYEQILDKMNKENLTQFQPTHESEIEWKKIVADMYNQTLVSNIDSWWNNSNVEGAVKEPLIYMGGIAAWMKEVEASLDGWKGFEVKKAM